MLNIRMTKEYGSIPQECVFNAMPEDCDDCDAFATSAEAAESPVTPAEIESARRALAAGLATELGGEANRFTVRDIVDGRTIIVEVLRFGVVNDSVLFAFQKILAIHLPWYRVFLLNDTPEGMIVVYPMAVVFEGRLQRPRSTRAAGAVACWNEGRASTRAEEFALRHVERVLRALAPLPATGYIPIFRWRSPWAGDSVWICLPARDELHLRINGESGSPIWPISSEGLLAMAGDQDAPYAAASYRIPEQVRESLQIDWREDIFSRQDRPLGELFLADVPAYSYEQLRGFDDPSRQPGK